MAPTTSTPATTAAETTTQEKQKCGICLEDLFSTTSRVGAVVPCGHCLHTDCFRQWQGSSYHRRISFSSARKPKCPLCNSPADTFVPLFVDAIAPTSSNNNPTTTATCSSPSSTPPTTTIVPDTVLEDILVEPSSSPMMDDVLANQDRIKTKLKRYKRQNKTLKQELQTERQEMEEMLVTTIQNFYKIMEKHEEERQRWCKVALELRRELDHTKKDQLRERNEWTLRQQWMQQQLDAVKKDCVKANQRVQSATEGLAELKIHHARRHSKLQVILQEKAKLVQENRKLKKAVLTTQGSLRSECLF